MENTCGCVLSSWTWPRAFLSLASEGLSLERLSLALASGFFCVLGLGLEPWVLDSTSDNIFIDETRVQVFYTSDKILLLILGHLKNFFLICEFYF